MTTSRWADARPGLQASHVRRASSGYSRGVRRAIREQCHVGMGYAVSGLWAEGAAGGGAIMTVASGGPQ